MFARPVPPLGQRQGFFCPEEAAWSLQGAGASLFCPCSCIVRCTLALWYVHLVQCTTLHHTLLHTCQCTQPVCMQLVSCVWQCAWGQGTWILLLPGKDMVLAWLGRFVGGWFYMEPGNELALMVRRRPFITEVFCWKCMCDCFWRHACKEHVRNMLLQEKMSWEAHLKHILHCNFRKAINNMCTFLLLLLC